MGNSMRHRGWVGCAAVCSFALAACTSEGGTSDTTTVTATTVTATTVTATTVLETTVLETTVPATTVLATTVPAGGGELTTPVGGMADLQSLAIAQAPFTGTADEFAHAIADELVAAHADCETPPTAAVSTVGESPAVATIDIGFGCDDSVAGAVYTATLDDPDGEGFVVYSATRQSRCWRAVDGALCV